MPGPQTVYGGIGKAWAHAVNTPFGFFKARTYEGGICTPLIAYWPKGIKGRNVITNEVGHVIDLMATCIDVAGTRYPEEYKGHTITPLQGLSLLPVLKGGDRNEHEYLFWEHYGRKALRHGKWKIVQADNASSWQLFDMEKDRTETRDVSDRHPDILTTMVAKWEEMAKVTNVFPLPSD